MQMESILKKVHVTYEGSTDYPEVDSDDYNTRMAIAALGVMVWDEQENIKWEELFTSLEEAEDGDKTTTTAKVYDCPTNFRYVTSFVYVGTKKYQIIKAKEVMIAQEKGMSDYAYFTGKPGSYKLHLSSVESGKTISYDYYRFALEPEESTDVPDMSRALFLVYFILWKLYENDTRNDMVTLYSGLADEVMSAMIIQNELPPDGHSNKVAAYGSGFGQSGAQ